jgi:4-diphosphocytidyl-2-C-methyl-D-erythritol kinase
MIRAAFERFGGGERPLLVLRALLRGADAGRHELDRLLDLLPDQVDFERRTNQTRYAHEHGETCEPHDLFRRRPVEADLPQRAVVEAGQHGHGQDFGAAALHRLLRGLQHFEAAARVHCDITHVERHRRLDRVRHGLRNVVPFLVEKNIDALGPERLDEGRALAREELIAHFEQAQPGSQQPHQRQRFVGAIHIKGKNQFVGHRRFDSFYAVKQFAPAKINLYLHILGRRADGFHELETLMAPISLGDTLDIDLIPAGIEFTCSDPALSDAKDNLATRAARIFLEEFKLATGVRIHLEKVVPVGAGLGGGSSDAATVLLALRKLTQVDCPDSKLAELAARLGSDIPFFIYRTPAICRGRGEIIEPVRLKENYQGLLVHPGFGVSTPWAYKTYAQNPAQGEPGRTFPDFTLRNDLEPPAFSKYPWLPAAKSWFQKQPEAIDSLMSGSGSSVFALTHSAENAWFLERRFLAQFGETLFSTSFSVVNADL